MYGHGLGQVGQTGFRSDVFSDIANLRGARQSA